MKKSVILVLLLFISFGISFGQVDDDSLIEELKKEDTEEILSESLKFKTFTTCDNLETTLKDFYENYKHKYQNYYKWLPMPIRRGFWTLDAVKSTIKSTNEAEVESDISLQDAWWASSDFSKTNEQVVWVNESEIVKTDWEYIYYMSDYYDKNPINKNYQERQKKNVFVIKADTMQIVKKIKLPKHFFWTKLYLQGDRLVIIASWRPEGDFQRQFWNDNTKTYTIVYDVEKPEKAKLVKVFLTEWRFSKSRLIGNKLYVISNKDVYRVFYNLEKKGDITAEEIVPKWLEIFATTDESRKNVKLSWEKKDYNVTSWYVSKCDSIEYILPENDTNIWYPQFNMISIIDIEDVEKKSNTKLIFWTLNEMYMSLDNLYITNNVYKTKPFRCGFNMRCISPFFYGWTNHTLIHKLNIDWSKLNYQTSILVKWSPLTQYSMDEYNSDFRILTSTRRWNSKWEEAHTDLYVLDKNLELKSSLQNLGEWEDFKSSRYIRDKLFLVTFEQIDPLFVIDLADSKNPKILWELKMPGYSTYLHPYDENHLIWIWYDTKENERWRVTNNWVKIDLYEIDYNRKPESKDNSWDIYVAQKYTKTFWEYWSSSEALKNPRMFMWHENKKDLFLPMSLKVNDSINMNDSINIYRAIDFFQGLVSINIDASKWISENYKITHLDTISLEAERKKECSKYTNQGEKICKELINWELYCSKKTYKYVPNYCYSGSPIWEYLASKSWNYSNDFVKRAIWIWDDIYTISDKKVIKSDIDSWNKKDIVIMR